MHTPAPINPIMRANILTLAEAYKKHRDLTWKTLSTYSHGDPQVLEKLRDDGDASITGRKYDVMIRWFYENWPDDLPMPKIRPTMVAQANGSKPRSKRS